MLKKKVLITNIDRAPPKFTPPVQGFRSKRTPCKTQEPENHILFSGTCPYRPNEGVPTRALAITMKRVCFPLPPAPSLHTHSACKIVYWIRNNCFHQESSLWAAKWVVLGRTRDWGQVLLTFPWHYEIHHFRNKSWTRAEIHPTIFQKSLETCPTNNEWRFVKDNFVWFQGTSCVAVCLWDAHYSQEDCIPLPVSKRCRCILSKGQPMFLRHNL